VASANWRKTKRDLSKVIMPNTTAKPNILKSIWQHKCPRCRKGNMYLQPNILPLKSMLDMPDRCAVCNQKMELESGFYFGTGYVSYALSVAFFVAWFIAYHVLIGISWKDNSVLVALFTGIVAVICLQPFLMRKARVLYLYMFVRYDADSLKTEG
jgi:uncharacterized protein (DUF983 family)